MVSEQWTEEPDFGWIIEKLERFVRESRPADHGDPAGGRAKALQQVALVRPILDRLDPGWRDNAIEDPQYEFYAEFDASNVLIGRLRYWRELDTKLAAFETTPSITAAGMHPLVWEAAKTQWNFGNHAEAVDAVSRAVNSMLQRKIDRRDVSESDLLAQSFSKNEPTPGKPRLWFLDEPTDDTAESKRQGVMDFGKGCFAAIRNPLAHLADDEIDLDEQQALESLAAFSLLARWIDQATLITAEETDGS